MTVDESSLGHVPDGAWAFDASVTACFDDMLARSIPEHDRMRAAVAAVAARFAGPHDVVLDLGCSRGEALAGALEAIARRYPNGTARGVGLEVSAPMLAAARERFLEDRRVEILELDLRRDPLPVAPGGAGVVLSVLTLQFVPITYRQRIVADVYEALRPGGALVLVEKVLGRTTELDEAMVDLYHRLKRGNGYSDEEVVRKASALEGVLVPLTASWNEDLLEAAGFRAVDCFWRWMNFAAWVALR